MDVIHINVGVAALAKGLLTLDAFAKGIHTLAHHGPMSLDELWVGPGRLTPDQLATVLEAIAPAARAGTAPVVEPATAPGPARTRAGVGANLQKPAPLPEATAATQVSLVSMPNDPGIAPTPSAAANGAAADVVGGRYRRLFPLGEGGLGEVHACEDPMLGRTVAVKAGHTKGDVDSYSSKLILAREARIISCLEHPNIIPIYDAGTDPSRGPFYVMRQVTETSLEHILKRKRAGEGDPREYTLHRLLRYLLQVCRAVDFAHHKGVIHCDIKPANVLLGEYGEVLLVDWGLAQSRAHPLGVRGGTLGFMAPEQMDIKTERLDERVDVFALGVILYEILAGTTAFPEVRNSDVTTVGHDPVMHYKRPPPPAASAGQPELPAELAELCMRAIAIDRDERLPTVRLIADAIDEFIEGSKQRERLLLEADHSADAGDELAERYHEFAEARPEKLLVFRALRADVVPWATVDEKQDLWDAEDIVRVTDALQVRTFHSAVSSYERALDAVPSHARARQGLARLYWSELQRAHRRGDVLEEIAYEQMLREVDDGTLVGELQRDAVLELAIAPHVATLTLAKLVEAQRVLSAGTGELIAERPTAQRSLPAGRYVVRATLEPGARPVTWPIILEPGSSVRIEIDPPRGRGLDTGEVFVPQGRARLGGDPLSIDGDEPIVVEVPSFVMQRYPVTFAQWLEFLDDLRRTAPAQVERHVPRTTLGMPTWSYGGGAWVPDASVPVNVVPVDPLRLPVFGVTAESAEAYAAWLSTRQGRRWRLPTEIEWEKAARGTDARVYPWGDHFDATFCKMRDSRPGQPLAEPIGAFELDVSPYGVCDLAGGVADWCIPDPRRTAPRLPREVVSRGGAWCDWPIDCRLGSRRRYLATEHSARVGVRLVRDSYAEED